MARHEIRAVYETLSALSLSSDRQLSLKAADDHLFDQLFPLYQADKAAKARRKPNDEYRIFLENRGNFKKL